MRAFWRTRGLLLVIRGCGSFCTNPVFTIPIVGRSFDQELAVAEIHRLMLVIILILAGEML
ncbi:hypothetical protein RchiOBHm_Chr2g0118671 [Rosa chinensis]|uniref:Uncharacterized protein n=1 Tax=Rosa chinensis TaxID=74649 RepID=A0A2P6RRS9_ROSCH|nr:hypothetical protein RchiOBHm_Chr2g0118671 [Rosa chinensis]